MNFVMEFLNFRIEYSTHYEYMIWCDADSHVFKWETDFNDLKPFSHPDHTPAQICIPWYISHSTSQSTTYSLQKMKHIGQECMETVTSIILFPS